MSLLELTAVELAKEIKAGKTTAVEAMKAVLEQIEKTEETYHCYITIDKEKAMQAAKEAQEKIEAGTLTGPLAGVPVAIKDNLCTKGVVTTCASKILENFVPQYDAEAVVKLQEAGAVMIGKTNMDEFAMGSTTETSAYGVTQTFCQDPALWTSMFPQQTQKTHFMPESSRMQKISFKAQG